MTFNANTKLSSEQKKIIALSSVGGMLEFYDFTILLKNGLIGIILSAALCYFMLFKNYNLNLALSLFTLFQGALVVLPPLFLCDLFPVQIRLTGVALSYNIGFVLFGGLTPIVVTTLIEHTQMMYMTPFLWLLLVSCITLMALWCYQTFTRTGVPS